MLRSGEEYPGLPQDSENPEDKAVQAIMADGSITDMTYTPGTEWFMLFIIDMAWSDHAKDELTSLNGFKTEFDNLNCQIAAMSIDSPLSLSAWKHNVAEIMDLEFPLISDYTRNLSEELGILQSGIPLNSVFIIDPYSMIRYSQCVDGAKRNVEEILRIVSDLQDFELRNRYTQD